MYWEIVEEIPKNWKIDKTAGSPVCGCVFITNGKSVINGQKRKLLRIKKKQLSPIKITKHKQLQIDFENSSLETVIIDEEYVKTVNDLARKKFQEKIIKDILFDLTVCQIEGWDKKEYIKELRNLLNNINMD